MTIFYAQPYDTTAEGFYFRTVDEYDKSASALKNEHGDPVEEFEIQFIDGEDIDCDLGKAWGVNQANLGAFFDAVDEWDEDQKTRYIIAVGECGYSHEQMAGDPDNVEIDIYRLMSLKELAEIFVEEGLFGDVPEHLQFYIDYDAISHDLAVDYSQTEIAGKNLIYRCS